MGSSHSSRRKPTSSSFKSTVATPPPKSTSAKVSLNSRSQSPASSPPTTTPTASESPKVTDEKVSPADGVPRNSHEKPIEVSERSPVSEPGIHPEFPTPSLEEVKNDFLMIKGSCMGVRKRPIVLRKPLLVHYK